MSNPLELKQKVKFNCWILQNYHRRFPSLKNSTNLVVVSLCVADLLMVAKMPVFFINLYHAGPYSGVLGAKVRRVIFVNSKLANLHHYSDLWVCVRGVRHGEHLVHHPADCREALGHLLGLQGQDGEGGGHFNHVPLKTSPDNLRWRCPPWRAWLECSGRCPSCWPPFRCSDTTDTCMRWTSSAEGSPDFRPLDLTYINLDKDLRIKNIILSAPAITPTSSAQGYLYTSTVDLLATDPKSLAFCWLLFSLCFLVPNTIILPSYIAITFLYRFFFIFRVKF